VRDSKQRLGPSHRLVREIGGAEQRHSGLRSEKPWFCVEGRGFDSRHLHPGVLATCQAHCWRKAGATADSGGPGLSLSTGTLWAPSPGFR